ncbi:hypothetical protein RI129_012998 [Pyrocoelia pectoralis]|uniref:CRAL-TRIO domain-containing protein n=1 Tax=Pyrocoelia pectoralis TaxID=417401 RepID=A0AAN7V3R1_9COLE
MPLKYASVALEYKNRTELRREDVQCLKDWLEKQLHLPKLDELEIIIILSSCNYSVELTKITIDNYYTLRNLIPEIFRKRDLKTWVKTLDVVNWIPLPKLTPEGSQILYWKLNNTDPSKYVFVDVLKCAEMILKMKLLETGTVDGLIFILDLDGFSLSHIAQIPVMMMKKLIIFLQEALPLKLKNFHLINIGTRLDKLMAIMKPFMKKDLFEMIHVHSNYVETLFNYIPRECVPKDIDGLLDTIQDLQEKVKEMVFNNMDFIENEETRIVDESKRLQKNIKFDHIFGIEGTFRKLELD